MRLKQLPIYLSALSVFSLSVNATDITDTNITANVTLNSGGVLFVDGVSTFDGPMLVEGATILEDGINVPWDSSGPSASYWNVTLEDGLFVFGDTSHTNSLNLDFNNGDTVLFWYPHKGAFRSIVATSDSADEANIGNYSFAAGQYAKAVGDNSIALGNSAYGRYGDGIAIGTLTENRYAGVAIGLGAFSDQFSIAVGEDAFAYRNCVAIGFGATANSANYEIAIGYQADAHKVGSAAVGYESQAGGDYSVSIGYHTKTNAYAMTALGAYNALASSQSTNTWVATDQLFVIGNGTDEVSRSNALVIYKNGDMDLAGNISVEGNVTVSSYGGDVPMGAFGN